MMSLFYAFIMGVGGDIDEMRGFDSAVEADAFGQERTAMDELGPDDPPDFREKYDLPVVICFELEKGEDFETGRYKRPAAIYQRGEKWVCAKEESAK
jgi:hypothetical protein